MDKSEQLIQAIEKRPVIYDFTSALFKNNGYRRKIWLDIAEELGMSSEECQKRWKRLKEKYMNFNKRIANGNGEKTIIMPAILNRLGFLKPFFANNQSLPVSSFTKPSSHEESSSSQTCDDSLKGFFTQYDPDEVECVLLSNNTTPKSSTSKKRSRVITENKSSLDIQKIIDAIHTPTEEYDSIDYFCLGLAKDLKSMAPPEQRRIKKIINDAMNDAIYIE